MTTTERPLPDVLAFVCGTLSIPHGFLVEGAEGTITVPVPAYLIRHPAHPRDGLLFDTGQNRLTYLDPQAYMPDGALATRTFHFTAADELPTQMLAAGLDPVDVRWVANSHLHYDHCGGNALFPDATVLVQRAEWDVAMLAPADSTAYRKVDFVTGQDVELVDGERDVFGDGTVRLIPTHGHTPGHQSLLVETTSGPLLLAADACYLQETLDDFALPGIVSDRPAVVRVLESFRRMREAGTTVVFGHDPEFWRQQRLAPELLS